MVIDLIFLLLGLIILVKGANLIVDSGAKLAKAMGVSEFIIGMTLVAIGTSLPELASSIAAALRGSSEFIVGNIIGSNIANISLVIGIAALVGTFAVKKSFLKSAYILGAVTLIFLLFAIDGTIMMIEGVVLLLLFIIYLAYNYQPEEKLHYGGILNQLYKIRGFVKLKNMGTLVKKLCSSTTYIRIFHTLFKYKTSRGRIDYLKREVEQDSVVDVLVLLLGAILVFFGSKYTVDGGLAIAMFLGVTANFISLTLVAIGTSLPEIVVSLVALKKKQGDILVGNIIGSNIANLLLIGGVGAILMPLQMLPMTLFFSMPFMVLLTVLFLSLIKTRWKMEKWEGFLLLVLYLLFIIGILLLMFFI